MKHENISLSDAVERSMYTDPVIRPWACNYADAICCALESLEQLQQTDVSQGGDLRRSWFELAEDERDTLLRLRDGLRIMADFEVCPDCGQPDCCCMIDADHPHRWVSRLFESN